MATLYSFKTKTKLADNVDTLQRAQDIQAIAEALHTNPFTPATPQPWDFPVKKSTPSTGIDPEAALRRQNKMASTRKLTNEQVKNSYKLNK